MDRQRYIEGFTAGVSAFVIWGFLPLYWKLVGALTPYQIFAQRVVWSFLFILLVLKLKKNMKRFKAVVASPENWVRTLLPSVFISINWLLYIWAVNNGYVLESSLGYFINPLILTLFGAVFYKEQLTKLQKVGLVFAGSGVLMKTFLYGQFPFVAITLACSFAIYGLLKKRSPLTSLDGLGFETLIIGIPSLAYMIFSEVGGTGITGNLPWLFWGLIVLSGPITAIPLLLYAESAKKLPLNVVGFLQYIAPTIMMVIGVLVFEEPFGFKVLLPFIPIWVGLIFFSYSQYQVLSGAKQPVS
ncbi:MAG: chloramphenicol-sensitive protein RarD [Clostridiales bacterium]|jgi:chloramphenicol-sensitive protein RarD|nr:chloramphenicol-sensitive protein RarD [Clostridiales bacterium]